MSEKKLRLEIVTPQKKVFSEDVSFLVAPGTDGELGILPEHAPDHISKHRHPESRAGG